MARRPRVGGGRLWRDAHEGGPIVAAPEVPLQLAGLAAWFDSRTTAQMTFGTGNAIASWASRAGAMGPMQYVQATPANQPVYVSSVAEFGGKPAVQFPAAAANFFDAQAGSTNQWKFFHDGSGASRFMVLRVDSTGGANQRFGQSAVAPAEHGMLLQFNTANLSLSIYNGSGTNGNGWFNSVVSHYARDVSRWQMWGYETGTQHSRVSGSSLTNADTSPPSTSNPTRLYRVGASNTATVPLKGYIAQDLYYSRVLTIAESNSLGAWAALEYGVAA